jgi:hypothetical protein
MASGGSISAGSARPGVLTIILIWLGWAAIMMAYQAFAPARLPLLRPDHATGFSADETGADSLRGRPYLARTGALGSHVAWDSQYYLSIALHGYDDPSMPVISPASAPTDPKRGLRSEQPTWTSINYAFFPAYPMAMRALAAPLGLFGLAPITAASLAGVIISLAGALGAVLAIADLTAASEPNERVRAGFYLLIWPGAAFLAQVYTEGLFIGLSFGALAMLRRRRWVWAAALAALGVWTRANGALLLIPFVWTWLADGGLRRLRSREGRGAAATALALAAVPALAYLAWRLSLGGRFEFVEAHYFGRGMLAIGSSLQSARDVADLVADGNPQAVAYYLAEALSILAALVCSAVLWRRDKALTLYGLAILGVALTSGAELGFPRYALTVPALFLVPARWGRSIAFDRAWSLANILGLGIWSLAFASGFWDG